MVCNKMLAAFAQSCQRMNSLGEWLTPSTLGTKITSIGVIFIGIGEGDSADAVSKGAAGWTTEDTELFEGFAKTIGVDAQCGVAGLQERKVRLGRERGCRS